jgi:hypothetical protein
MILKRAVLSCYGSPLDAPVLETTSSRVNVPDRQRLRQFRSHQVGLIPEQWELAAHLDWQSHN